MTDRLRAHTVAQILGVEVSTLYSWRARSYGPASYKFGGAVVYDRVVVEAWIEQQRETTSRGDAA